MSFLKTATVDIFKHPQCRTGLLIGAIWVAPIVFVVSITAAVRSVPLSIVYTVASLIVIAKATKYAYAIVEIIGKATSEKDIWDAPNS